MSALGERGSNSHISESFGLLGADIGVEGRAPSSDEPSGNPSLLDGLPIITLAQILYKIRALAVRLKKVVQTRLFFGLLNTKPLKTR